MLVAHLGTPTEKVVAELLVAVLAVFDTDLLQVEVQLYSEQEQFLHRSPQDFQSSP
jgi:hypothetical protein